MLRLSLLLLVILTVAGCWMFEKTDERPAPVVDALQDAIAEFQAVSQNTPTIPVPGLPTWIAPTVVGLVAGIGVFVNVLIARGSERKKMVANALGNSEVVATKPDN